MQGRRVSLKRVGDRHNPAAHNPRRPRVSLRVVLLLIIGIAGSLWYFAQAHRVEVKYACLLCGRMRVCTYDGIGIWKVTGTPAVAVRDTYLSSALELAEVAHCTTHRWRLCGVHARSDVPRAVWSGVNLLEQADVDLNQLEELVTTWDAGCREYCAFVSSRRGGAVLREFLPRLLDRSVPACPYEMARASQEDAAWRAWPEFFALSREYLHGGPLASENRFWKAFMR